MLSRRLVLVGGGHAHIQVLRRLRMEPLEETEVVLISSETHAPYSGMLPGYLAGWYSAAEMTFDLRKICGRSNVRFVHATVTGIDLEKGRIFLSRNYPSLDFDWCSINVGIQPKLPKGSFSKRSDVLPLKPISSLISRWEEFLSCPRKSGERFAIIGGGAAGVEVALVLRQRFNALGITPEIHLFHSDKRLLEGHSEKVSDFFLKRLKSEGVAVHLEQRIGNEERGIDPMFDAYFWATDAKAPEWFRSSGFPVDEEGFLRVDRHLRVEGTRRFFGAGDCVRFLPRDLPKSGVYAVRAGKILAENLIRAVRGEKRPLKVFRPQKRALALITSGNKRALASRGFFGGEGEWIWRWKDRIDRRFMDRFSVHGAPKEMKGMGSDEEMICGGCGSKVGAEVLKEALAPATGKPKFEDVAVLPLPSGEKCFQTVDYFERLLADPYLFGKVAANHALGDIYAKGLDPIGALAIVQVPKGRNPILRDNLRWVLEGIGSVLKESRIQLAGGHTFQGDHFGVGLAVTGALNEKSVFFPKGPPRKGDALLVTQPLGVGTILAAHQRGIASGRDVEEALDVMLQSNREASRILKAYHVSACTDVTGFGLCGHLVEMLEGGGGTGVEIFSSAVPVLSSAKYWIERRIESTLAPENLFAFSQIFGRSPRSEVERLYIDPQTSGGLLAFIRPEEAESCVSELKMAGYGRAAVIGRYP